MKNHNLKFCILNPDSMNSLKVTELAGRTCYKSEKRIKEGSEITFNNMLCNTYKHLSVTEHSLITVWFQGSRGFTHEMVRHRHCSFSQESTRYCNYGKNNEGLNILPPMGYLDLNTFIEPLKDPVTKEIIETEDEHQIRVAKMSDVFIRSLQQTEANYLELIELNTPAQLARDVLPIGTKADIVVSGNYRTWLELLRQRLAKPAHPIMRAMMTPLAKMLKEQVPVIFDSLELLEEEDKLHYAEEISLEEYMKLIGA